MLKPLIYLGIFTLFFWVGWYTVAFLVSPVDQSGAYIPLNISLFLALFFAACVCSVALVLAIYKSTRPNRKLPALLIRDSLNHGYIVATWLTGLLVLQLLGSATLINLGLWLLIFLVAEWTISLSRRKRRQQDHL